jgi:5-methyltetrahydrofolate--homocysteine methyltransferase
MELHFSERDWERIVQDYGAWWAHELQRPLVYVTGKALTPGVDYSAAHRFVSNYPWSVSEEQIIEEVTRDLEATHYYGDAYPRWWVNFGPGILAGLLGARVHVVPETVWFEPPRVVSIDQLHLAGAAARDAGQRWWRRITRLTELAVGAWQGQVQVCHTDLGGNLDVLASFRTTQGLLYDLYDAPEEVDRLIGEVTEQWLAHYAELDAIIRPTCHGTSPWAPIWAEGRSYMLQSDFAYMISPDMFERFALPDLVACCDVLDQGFYHLDGPGQIRHLDLLLDIPRLRGIQWIPGDGHPPPDQWLELLKRIVDGGKLCQIYVTAQGARHVVRNIGGRGFLFVIQDEMTPEEARAFLKQLADDDISCE